MAGSNKANLRRSWLAQRVGTTETDSTLVAQCAAVFKVSELTVRKDLKWVYDRWIQIDAEMAPMHKARFMELGFTILQEARDAAKDPLQHSTFAPVVAQFKNLAVLSGVMRDGLQGSQAPASVGETRPQDLTLRERISQLKNNPAVRERAMKLGLDLDE